MKARAKINRLTLLIFIGLIVVFIVYQMNDMDDEIMRWVLPISIGIMASSLSNVLNVYTIEGDELKYGIIFFQQSIPISQIHKVEVQKMNPLSRVISGSPKEFLSVYYTKYDSFNLLLPVGHPFSQRVKEIAESEA